MAYGLTSRGSGNADTATTYVHPSRSYTAGTHIWIVVHAMRNNHSGGFGTDWAVTDSATTNTITWTKQGTQSDTFQGTTFAAESVVYTSSELTATESFTITIDPDSASGSNQFWYDFQFIEAEDWAGTFDQLVSAAAEATSDTITFATLTSGDEQTLVTTTQTDDPTTSYTWDTLPSGFAELSGSATTGNSPTRAITSSTNVTETVGDGFSGAPNFSYSTHVWGIVADVAATGPNTGTATHDADASVTATGARQSAGTATHDADASIAAVGSSITSGVATLAADASIAAAGARPSQGGATFAASAAIGATGARQSKGGATFNASGTIVATGARASSGGLAFPLKAIGAITATGARASQGVAVHTAQATIFALGNSGRPFGVALFEASASIAATGARQSKGGVTYSGAAAITTATGAVMSVGVASMSAVVTLFGASITQVVHVPNRARAIARHGVEAFTRNSATTQQRHSARPTDR